MRFACHAQVFANGYYLGELLNCWNLQPDFDEFQQSEQPTASVANFKRLQASTLGHAALHYCACLPRSLLVWKARLRWWDCDRLARVPRYQAGGLMGRGMQAELFHPRLQASLLRVGINLDSTVASNIIRKEKGAAAKLVYRIKTAVEGLTRDLSSSKRTGNLLSKTLVRAQLFCVTSVAACTCLGSLTGTLQYQGGTDSCRQETLGAGLSCFLLDVLTAPGRRRWRPSRRCE